MFNCYWNIWKLFGRIVLFDTSFAERIYYFGNVEIGWHKNRHSNSYGAYFAYNPLESQLRWSYWTPKYNYNWYIQSPIKFERYSR